jgi:hypothetical protein
MNTSKPRHNCSLLGGLTLALVLTACAPSAHANVYATNVKLNGGLTNIAVMPGSSVTISYILNEPASAGITIKILSGSTLVRTLTVAAGAAGSTRGLNTVTWDGNDSTGNPAPGGTYSVSITAASQGYDVWKMTTDDNNDGNNVWEGRGIAVDQNTNSPYYGRIFVGNSAAYTGPYLGYQVGMLKCNADCSYADEGGFSTGGYNWAGDYFSPWHIEVSDDDSVYINDWTGSGLIMRWDPTLSDTSRVDVLRTDNYPVSSVNMSGPAIFGAGTNTQVWMADINWPGSMGVLRWDVTNTDGACTLNDLGLQVVGIGTDLSLYPYDVALDKSGNIYAIQYRNNPGDPSSRILRFPAYDPLTNGYAPQYTADWAIGSADDTMGGACGIAVDPAGTYVAVAFRGIAPSTGRTNGCTQIFYATNGTLVTNLDLGVTISGNITHQNTDCAWDAVGNLYYIDNYLGVWRAWSPPGANQATTVAVPKFEIVQPVTIKQLGVSGGTVTIDFLGSASDSAAAFTLLSASEVTGSFNPAAGANISQVSPGVFRATVPTSGPAQFYRIKK